MEKRPNTFETDVIRVMRLSKEERRAVLLLTPGERKAALLEAARLLQQSLHAALFGRNTA